MPDTVPRAEFAQMEAALRSATSGGCEIAFQLGTCIAAIQYAIMALDGSDRGSATVALGSLRRALAGCGKPEL